MQLPAYAAELGYTPMLPSVAGLTGEALVVAMAQQAAMQYAISDPAVIAWLQVHWGRDVHDAHN